MFSLAQDTIPLDESTWTTSAPAYAHATVAPPVYANKFSTFISITFLSYLSYSPS